MHNSRCIKYTAAAMVTMLIPLLSIFTYGQTAAFINPGIQINTGGDDYSPSCTQDGKTIVFSSKSEIESSHKIFTCTNENGVWSDPRPILEISSESNDETPFISADGQILLFSSDRPGGFTPSATSDGNKRITFDIYISKKENGQWSIPQLLQGDVNTTMNERCPSLSPDGKTLFFTRFPYRNISRSEIFMAAYENGKFVNVKALPESINSGSYEISFMPSYKQAGRYYFASRRRGGYGSWDIYYTVLGDKGFSEPANAGDGINTMHDDLFFTESADISMLCSNRPGGLGGYDLYLSAIKKQEEDTAAKDTVKESGIRVTVKNKNDGSIIPGAVITVYRQSTALENSSSYTEESLTCGKDGVIVIPASVNEKWIMLKPDGKKYRGSVLKVKLVYGKVQEVELLVETVSDSIVSDGDKGKPETEGDDKKGTDTGSIIQDKSKNTGDGQVIIQDENVPLYTDNDALPELKPVYFRYNSVEIRTDSIPVLHGIIQFMRKNPGVHLRIKGHSDRRGSKRANYRLSRMRAERVFRYLKSMGISPDRMTIISYGETDPQVSNGKRDDALNRRVEFEFTNGKNKAVGK